MVYADEILLWKDEEVLLNLEEIMTVMFYVDGFLQ